MGRLVVATEVGASRSCPARTGGPWCRRSCRRCSGLLRAVDPTRTATRSRRPRAGESYAWPVVGRTEDVYRRVVAGERLPRDAWRSPGRARRDGGRLAAEDRVRRGSGGAAPPSSMWSWGDPSIERGGSSTWPGPAGSTTSTAPAESACSREYWTAVRDDVERTSSAFDLHDYLRLQGEFERARGMWRWWTDLLGGAPPVRASFRLSTGDPTGRRPVDHRGLVQEPGPGGRARGFWADRLLHLVRDPRGVAWSPGSRTGATTRPASSAIPSRPAWRTARSDVVNGLSEIAARRFTRAARDHPLRGLPADPARVLDVVGGVLGTDLSELGPRRRRRAADVGTHVAGTASACESIRLRADVEWRGVSTDATVRPCALPGADVALRVPVVAVRAAVHRDPETGGAGASSPSSPTACCRRCRTLLCT
jgi:hypothetical protein